MKRTRLFMGITAGFLAVVGVAASRATNMGIGVTRYYCTTNDPNAYCMPKFSICTNYSPADQKCFFTIRVGTDDMVYTYTLYSNGRTAFPFMHCGQLGACSFVIRYLNEF